METKFDKLYKIIMEQGYALKGDNSYADAGSAMGKAEYSLNSIGTGNVELYGKRNGELILNPIDGNPIKWNILAQYFPSYDCITGQKIPKDRVVFELKRGSSRKNNMYVDIETYKNAYANNDIETIEKLKAIGLEPGFEF